MLIAFAIFAVSFVSFVIIAAIYFYPGSAKISSIPGLDPSDANGGNFEDITSAGSFHEFLVKLHKDHGPIASFWYGPRFTVSVASPKIFKDLKGVFDRPGELFKLFEPLITADSIQYCNGQEGRKRRSTTDPSWGHDMLNHFCSNFNELGEEVVKKLSSLPKEEHIPLNQYCLALTIKGLSQTSFGDYFKDDRKCYELKHNYEICWNEMENQLGGELPLEGSENQKKFDEALQKVKDMVGDIIKLRRKTPPKPHERAFIDVLLENEDIYNESKLLADTISYMIGGFHTSGNLLVWTIYFLSTHKDVEEKLYQEVIKVLGDNNSISPSNIEEFKYMKQVFNESLRLSVLAPWAAKVQEVDIELGGHIIPKGTPVVTALGVVLQDETIWPLPNNFDPDRFSPENVRARDSFAFQPFGLPKRICPGYRFAYYELTVFLAILVKNFKWNLVEGQVVESAYKLVTSSKEEIWMRVEKRD